MYKENHSLGEWYKRSLMAMMKEKNSLCYNKSAVCQLHKKSKGRSSR